MGMRCNERREHVELATFDINSFEDVDKRVLYSRTELVP